jgi:autotransporter-associated beta strand protein
VLQVGNGVSNGTLGTGAVTNNASLVFNRLSALSVGVVISGTGSVTQAGPGALTFTNANTYMGDTLVNAGTLTLSGSGSFANSPTISLATGTLLSVGSVSSGANHNGSRFALASGQTLKGTGTVSGNMAVRNGATLAPGGSIGTLNTGSVTIDSGGTLALELDIGGTPDADLLNVTGTSVVITGATLNLTLSNVTPGPDKTFLVLANDFSDAITGTFASITGLPVGYLATLDYAYSGTDVLGRVGTGNDLAVTIITFIPETRAWVMVGAVGAVALGVARWRARQRGAAG